MNMKLTLRSAKFLKQEAEDMLRGEGIKCATTTGIGHSPNQVGQRSLQYYHCQGYGHRQSKWATMTSHSKDQKGSTPVSQSSQKKSRAMVAHSSQDGEEAFKYVKMEGTRSKRNLEEEWYREINQQ